ncbi:OmpH family outer membrane protein [Candidatus Nitrotoga sp. M5]|uniref:OmpH family outer membrane protein n=1 Tax=Candidatus Nitrotoga sp. M5 TaxID=2890409 RepID=UPI001EF1FEAE|nr:OmpH family outer membrane protein [Candidatus Nitrotoga sp. M5]CAH1386847.1 Periplasmic chaperone for outer membrane proteins Skp [Candidatus Nitrotoga sp. M5]
MKIFSKRLLQILLLLGCTQALAADLKVGIVNTERIMRESSAAEQAEKNIEKEFSVRNQKIKKVATDVQELQLFLEKERLTLSNAKKRDKERELANLNVNLQRMQRTFSEDLNLRKNEEMSVILEHANKAIQELAEKEKYDLILQEAVYHNPKIDITEKVIKYMNDAK